MHSHRIIKIPKITKRTKTKTNDMFNPEVAPSMNKEMEDIKNGQIIVGLLPHFSTK